LKKIFISGNFNILHPGHLRLFRYAKEIADILIVGVFSDKLAGKNSLVNENLRLESVKSNSYVNQVLLIDQTLEKSISKLKPNYILKGKEYENSYNIEETIVKEYGGNLIFSSGEVVFSSLDLLKKSLENKLNFNLPQEYLLRHFIETEKLIKLVNNFSNLKILVIGDLIVDEYITCDALGMSQEDPTIVVTPIESKKFIGGAGIVASHAASLGSNVNFITVLGDDINKDFTEKTLLKYNVNGNFLVDDTRPTTLKQRFITKNKTLLRVSHLHQTAINLKLQKEIINLVKNIITNTDIVIFSDFNYGCLPKSLVDNIIKIAKKNSVMMIADSQSSSQLGDISRFKNMNLITPTEREARLSVRDNESGLVILAEKLRKKSNANNIFLKIGEEGLLVHAETSNNNSWLTDRIPALNLQPVDVAGAGDSMMITSAMILSSGGNIWEAAYIGSIAAAIQVGRVGNIPLKVQEIFDHINS
jgi:rfaE bifunctional protein kinase chain/domain